MTRAEEPVNDDPGVPEAGDALRRIVEVLGGDVGEVLAKLRGGRLSGRFASWVREGENLPVTAEEITDALGDEHVAVIAEQTGKSRGEAVQAVADELPALIDGATPGGDPAALEGLASTTASAAYLRAYPGGADSGSSAPI